MGYRLVIIAVVCLGGGIYWLTKGDLVSAAEFAGLGVLASSLRGYGTVRRYFRQRRNARRPGANDA